MQIKFLNIKNFKSIKELEINNVENCLILVGKNNTGKTVVLLGDFQLHNLRALYCGNAFCMTQINRSICTHL